MHNFERLLKYQLISPLLDGYKMGYIFYHMTKIRKILNSILISLLPIFKLSYFQIQIFTRLRLSNHHLRHQPLRPWLRQPGQRHRSRVRRHHERKRIVTERVRRLCPVRRWPRQGRALAQQLSLHPEQWAVRQVHFIITVKSEPSECMHIRLH